MSAQCQLANGYHGGKGQPSDYLTRAGTVTLHPIRWNSRGNHRMTEIRTELLCDRAVSCLTCELLISRALLVLLLTVRMNPSKLHQSIDVADLYDEDTDVSTDGDAFETLIEKIAPEVHVEANVPAGCLPDEAYENSLPPIRLAVRRVLVRCVEWESQVLGRWQVCI